MTDDKRLAEIRERLEAATPTRHYCRLCGCPSDMPHSSADHAPAWTVTEWVVKRGELSDYAITWQSVAGDVWIAGEIEDKADADLIAHSRSDVPWLLDKVAEQAKEIERLQAHVDTLLDQIEERDMEKWGDK